MEKNLEFESAFPEPYVNDPNLGISHTPGMSKRFYAACAVLDDFDTFKLSIQELIVGREAPKHKPANPANNITIKYSSKEYLQWLIEGRAKWRYMQADELLKQEYNDNDTDKYHPSSGKVLIGD